MDSMEDPTLAQLAVFRAVAATGSFSAAARALGRAQSVVSYTIASLEASLGVTLFDRDGRRPTLTDAGRVLLQDAHAVAGQMERLVGRASALRAKVEPEIVVVVDPMFPTQRLVDALGAMVAAYPGVGVRLRSEALDAVPAQIRAGEAHLGVCPAIDAGADDLDPLPVGRVELVTVAAPAHPLAAAPAATPEHLTPHVQIVLSPRGSTSADRGVASPRTWRVGDLPLRIALVRAGFGWANVPRHLVAEDLAAGRLVAVPRPGPPVLLAMVAVTHRAHPPGPAGRCLQQALVASS